MWTNASRITVLDPAGLLLNGSLCFKALVTHVAWTEVYKVLCWNIRVYGFAQWPQRWCTAVQILASYVWDERFENIRSKGQQHQQLRAAKVINSALSNKSLWLLYTANSMIIDCSKPLLSLLQCQAFSEFEWTVICAMCGFITTQILYKDKLFSVCFALLQCKLKPSNTLRLMLKRMARSLYILKRVARHHLFCLQEPLCVWICWSVFDSQGSRLRSSICGKSFFLRDLHMSVQESVCRSYSISHVVKLLTCRRAVWAAICEDDPV